MTGSSGVRVTTRAEHRTCEDEGCGIDALVDVSIDPETHSTFWECSRGHQHESTTWDDYTDPDEDA